MRAKGVPAFAVAGLAAFALARCPELQHDHCLVELCDCREHLTNQCSRRIIRCAREVGAVRCEHASADARQLTDDRLGDLQIADDTSCRRIPGAADGEPSVSISSSAFTTTG
jgi:hypothetical protein